MIRWLGRAVLLLVGASILWVVAYRFVDPPITYLMARDYIGGHHVKRDWRPLAEIDRDLPRALIGAEDSRFCSHHGFDREAIAQAFKANEAGKRLRGGSTISQQTAKNVFLWPERSWLRKGLEAWFTLLIELLWGKPRIMEVYVNVVEWGRGIYGAEAAARQYFGKGAAKLTEAEAARLAAIVPQPLKRSASTPGKFTRRYAQTIDRRIDIVRNDALDACIRTQAPDK